jgi:dihydrofolate synthase/folylpolyglutamate synthase
MAFLHFARQKVDIAVVETGLGGSWDATNIVSPILSVFTPISLDHTDRLGREISAIASDKVGIIKSKIPVVSSWQENSALERIERKVGEQNCVFYYAPEVMELVEGKLNFRSSHITINCKTNPQLSGEYQLQLPGRHQWLNLATALTSALVLQKQGIIIKNAHLKSAVELTNWPGRLQILQEKPLVYYDVAHNPGAATVLVDFFRELFPGKKVKILLGMVKDKDYYNFLRIVSTFSSDFIFTRLPTTRTLEPEMLLQEASARDLPARVIENPAEALENSLLEAKPEDTILITGSHYLGQPILSKYLTN